MGQRNILSFVRKGKPAISGISKPAIPKVVKLESQIVRETIESSDVTTTTSIKVTEQESKPIKSPKFESRWKIVGTHLIHNLPHISNLNVEKSSSLKIAAFDLDQTLINTKSGKSFARGSSDWKWWAPGAKAESIVPKTLKSLAQQGFLLVIFTNQGGVLADKSKKSYINFIERVNQVVNALIEETQLTGEDILVFASPKLPSKETSLSAKELHRQMRKPEIGMWSELESYLGESYVIDKSNSFYVGDAAGRPSDHSESDMMFAQNLQLTFKIPEEQFVNADNEVESK